MATILIKNGRVWDGERFLCADVLTQDALVAKLEPNITDSAEFLYDATGCIVSAGLIDAHVHFRGVSSDAYGTPADLCTLPFGVTAAADAGVGQGNAALLDAFAVKSCVFTSVDIADDEPQFDKAEKLLAAYCDKAVGLKVYFDVHVSGVRTIRPLRKVVEYAHARGMTITVHTSNPPVPMHEVCEALEPGDILTHAYHGGEHNVSADDYAALKAAQARGVVIDAGFAGHVHTDFAVFQGALAHAAVPDILSTDITKLSLNKRGGKYSLPLCMSLARNCGMSEEAVFAGVTGKAAAALRKQGEWGKLAVGRAADIAVLRWTEGAGYDLTDAAGNRVRSDAGYQNQLTVLNGEVLYKR